MSALPEGYEPVAFDEAGNPLVCADTRSCAERGSHWWEDATSIYSRRRVRICRQCGLQEEYGEEISEEERAEALAEFNALRAQTMIGEPAEYFADDDF